MWGGNMMGWGGPGTFGFGHWLWWALLVGGAIVLVRWLLRDGRLKGRTDEDRALSILKERYARGDIDKAEFDTRKRDIA
jgi:putative membrane protein